MEHQACRDRVKTIQPQKNSTQLHLSKPYPFMSEGQLYPRTIVLIEEVYGMHVI